MGITQIEAGAEVEKQKNIIIADNNQPVITDTNKTIKEVSSSSSSTPSVPSRPQFPKSLTPSADDILKDFFAHSNKETPTKPLDNNNPPPIDIKQPSQGTNTISTQEIINPGKGSLSNIIMQKTKELSEKYEKDNPVAEFVGNVAANLVGLGAYNAISGQKTTPIKLGGEMLAGAVGSIESFYDRNTKSIIDIITPEGREYFAKHPGYFVGSVLGEIGQGFAFAGIGKAFDVASGWRTVAEFADVATYRKILSRGAITTEDYTAHGAATVKRSELFIDIARKDEGLLERVGTNWVSKERLTGQFEALYGEGRIRLTEITPNKYTHIETIREPDKIMIIKRETINTFDSDTPSFIARERIIYSSQSAEGEFLGKKLDNAGKFLEKNIDEFKLVSKEQKIVENTFTKKIDINKLEDRPIVVRPKTPFSAKQGLEPQTFEGLERLSGQSSKAIDAEKGLKFESSAKSSSIANVKQSSITTKLSDTVDSVLQKADELAPSPREIYAPIDTTLSDIALGFSLSSGSKLVNRASSFAESFSESKSELISKQQFKVGVDMDKRIGVKQIPQQFGGLDQITIPKQEPIYDINIMPKPTPAPPEPLPVYDITPKEDYTPIPKTPYRTPTPITPTPISPTSFFSNKKMPIFSSGFDPFRGSKSSQWGYITKKEKLNMRDLLKVGGFKG